MNSTSKILLLFIAIFISNATVADNTFKFKNLKLKKIGIHMGVDKDLLSWNGMQGQYFSSLIPNRELSDLAIDRRNAQHQQFSALCGIPNIRANFVFELPKHNRELHLGLVGVFQRISGTYFTQYMPDLKKYDIYNFGLHSNEIAIEANYVAAKEIAILKDAIHLNLYGSLGTNVGYQFANTVKVRNDELRLIKASDIPIDRASIIREASRPNDSQNINSNTRYKTSNAINQRVYAGVSFGFTFFNQIELGANAKLGNGYRYHFPSDFTGTKFRSFDFSVKYIIK